MGVWASRVRHPVLLLTTLAAAVFVRGPDPGAAPAPVRSTVAPTTTRARHSVGVGRVAEYRIVSKPYARERRVWVYTPPGYVAEDSTTYDLLVAFDGAAGLGDVRLPSILDSLVAAKRSPPRVAVLIDDGSSSERLADLANHRRFVTFLADEVVPWVRRHWKVTHDPRRTIVTGSSAGGLASAYVALERPDLFGNVLSQSAALWRGSEGTNGAPYEWLTDQYASAPRLDVRFFLDVGALETAGAMGGSAPSILDANRRFRDVLRAKGYVVTYTEVPEGVHAVSSWRPRLPVGIVTLTTPPDAR